MLRLGTYNYVLSTSARVQRAIVVHVTVPLYHALQVLEMDP